MFCVLLRIVHLLGGLISRLNSLFNSFYRISFCIDVAQVYKDIASLNNTHTKLLIPGEVRSVFDVLYLVLVIYVRWPLIYALTTISI